MTTNRREILRDHYIRLISKLTLRVSLVVILASMLVIAPAVDAAQITGRSLTLSTSSPSASGAGVTYAFAFTVPTTGTVIKGVQIQLCTTPLGACTGPTGLVTTSSALSAQPTGFGAGAGWTVGSTAGDLEFQDNANATDPSGSQAVTFNTITNPSTANTAFYGRITTYTTNTYTGAIDTGNVAASTEDTGDMAVNATVAEALTFCVGTTATATGANPCGTVSGNSLTLSPNPLTTASLATGTSQMGASTNAGSGLIITYFAGQFTNGTHNFANGFTSSGATSSPGTEEFGLNASASGTGAAVTAPYNGANYAWNPSTVTTIGNSGAAAINTGNWTVTYGANVAGTTPFGSYLSTFVYVCTPSF